MRIWPPNAAKCCKNAGKFFPDVGKEVEDLLENIIKYIVELYIGPNYNIEIN